MKTPGLDIIPDGHHHVLVLHDKSIIYSKASTVAGWGVCSWASLWLKARLILAWFLPIYVSEQVKWLINCMRLVKPPETKDGT